MACCAAQSALHALRTERPARPSDRAVTLVLWRVQPRTERESATSVLSLWILRSNPTCRPKTWRSAANSWMKASAYEAMPFMSPTSPQRWRATAAPSPAAAVREQIERAIEVNGVETRMVMEALISRLEHLLREGKLPKDAAVPLW